VNQHPEPVSERCIRGLAVGLIITALALLTVRQCCGADKTVVWDNPTNNTDGTPLTDLAGARIYIGVASSNYTRTITVPITGSPVPVSSSCVITGLTHKVRYYTAAKAFNSVGAESDFCNEITFVATTKPQKPVRLRVQ